ncbi:hypothetical protein FB451DRAFT_607100 [Mycena latifolia]|nr:hypothetical protein FB451DRAFT_607100 [Mycena latifolia]
MPVDCSVSCRRSRRLSTQDLISPDEEFVGELLYPDSDPETITSPPPQSHSVSPVVDIPPPPARTSHARQRPEDHIPRPPNPFICFRSDYCTILDGKVPNHRLVSKLAGQAWAALDDTTRKKYEDIALEKKRLHAIQYPGYAYAPSSRSGGKGKKRKPDDDCDYEERPTQSKRRRSRGGTQLLSVATGVRSEGPISPTNCGRKRARLAPAAGPNPRIDRSQTPELSPNASSESPASEFILRTPAATSPHLVCDYDDFVPTAEIPPLFLDGYFDAPASKLSADRTVKSASHPDYFKTDIPQQTRDESLWFNPDGTVNGSPGPPTNSLCTDTDDPYLCPINYADVQFTKPFALAGLELDLEDLIHTDRLQ